MTDGTKKRKKREKISPTQFFSFSSAARAFGDGERERERRKKKESERRGVVRVVEATKSLLKASTHPVVSFSFFVVIETKKGF